MTTLPVARRHDSGRWRGIASLPSVVVAMVAIQVAASLALVMANGLGPRQIVAELTAVVIIGALSYGAVGALIVRYDRAHPIGWLFCAAGLGNAFFAWSAEYARYSLVTHPGSLPAAEPLYWLNIWAWVPVQALVLILVPLLFPSGKSISNRWRAVAVLGMTAVVALSVALAFGPKDDAFLPELGNPYAIGRVEALLGALGNVATVGVVVSLAAAVVSLASRYRRANGVERAQLQWFGLGVVLLMTGFVAAAGLFLTGLDPAAGLLGPAILLLLFPALPAATGVAILRYRLFDVDLVLNRMLVYGILTTCLVTIYAGVVLYLGAVFHASGNPLVSLAGTGVVAVLFAPLRDRVQRAINRLMYGERDDPYAVLSRLARRLEATIEPTSALPVLAETVRTSLRLPYVAILLDTSDGMRIVADSGVTQPLALRLPISYAGTRIGELALAPRGRNEALSAADRRLLDELARQAGVVAHAARLTAELEQSRRRIVEAREDARRRLGSDLHDGLGHRLVALLRQGERAARLIDDDPAEARHTLDDLTERVRAVVADVRAIAHTLRPPELDLLGLAGALRERAGVDDGLHVSVEAPESVEGLPVAVESAVYYIVQEALANVHRHSRATRCHIRLTLDGVDGNELGLSVEDNGQGIDPARRQGGLGLASMRDRVLELDGAFEVGAGAAGGTCLVARIPVRMGPEPAHAQG